MTKRATLAIAMLAALGSVAYGKPPIILHPPPLAVLPSIARVRLEVAVDHVVLVEEVDLPRGDWRAGDLSFFVAFGAPGTPDAFDAHLVPVADGALAPADTDVGDKLVVDPAPRRPAAAHDLLGSEEMAGVVVHVPEGALRHALAPGGMAALRFRSLLKLPAGNARTGQEMVVRLGRAQTTPLTLGRIEVVTIEDGPPVIRADAHLCGPSADPWPLAVAIGPLPTGAPRAPLQSPTAQAPIAPVLAVRHFDDDLCVRFWTLGT